MHHGYDIQDDDIWKSIVEKMKSYIDVWKRQIRHMGVKLLLLKMY
jgi:molybdopterin synthase catalytic subunit